MTMEPRWSASGRGALGDGRARARAGARALEELPALPAPVLERLGAPGAERPAAAGAAVVGDALAGTALAAVDAAGAPRCLRPAAPPAPAAVRARPRAPCARDARPAAQPVCLRACWPVVALAAMPIWRAVSGRAGRPGAGAMPVPPRRVW